MFPSAVFPDWKSLKALPEEERYEDVYKRQILIYIAGAIPTAVFIMTGYLQSIPLELEEAAVIDGLSLIHI